MKGKLIMTVAEMQNREAWLAMRNKGIGGSEAACIIGMSKWKSPFQLWLEKTGQVEPEDISDKECVYWGNVFEQAVADRFCIETGKKVRRQGMLQDELYPFMFANVDRWVVGENAGLECKTTNAFNKDEWEGDNIPDAYYCQCQWYMMVTGADKWYIACLIGGNSFVWKEVPRNEETITALRDAAIIFWTKVADKQMPEVDGSKNCSEALLRSFPGGQMDEVMLPDDTADFANLLEMKKLYKDLEKQIKEQENKIKKALGDNEVARTTNYKITWKTQGSIGKFDRKAFDVDYPGVYDRYYTPGTTRKLTIKEI